jgi:uncharacterized membrane protein YdjX (TVP38/TMEM64 family)
MSAKALLRSSALFATLVLVAGLMTATDLGAMFDEAWIDAYVRGQGVNGWLVFIAAGLVFTALGLPRQLVAFMGGYAFGLATGTGLALVAVTLGCIVAFHYARFVGRDFVAHRFPSKVRRIDQFLSENPLSMTLLIRFLPLGSNLATNLAAGVSSVRAAPFVTGSMIGYLPQTVVFALVGSGVGIDAWFRIGLGGVLLAVSGMMGVSLYRRHRHGLSFDDEVDRQLDTGAP